MKYPQFTRKQGLAFLSPELSFTAKGVLAYLMLLPEQEALMSELVALAVNMTPEQLFAALLELETACIIAKEVIRPDTFSIFPPQLKLKPLPPYTSDATDAVREQKRRAHTNHCYNCGATLSIEPSLCSRCAQGTHR